MKTDKGIERLILLLFFLSGFCGMLYVFSCIQGLKIFLGPSLLSIISVITIFLGGMSMGGFFTGRFIDGRTDPLKIYGLLEGAIGIYAIMLPWLILWASLIYKVIYPDIRLPFHISFALRFLLCSLILMVPSFVIGAVWPVISKLLIHKIDNPGRATGKIYGINILGWAVGALTAGLFFLPNFGVNSTLYFAACIDLIICACAVLLHRNIRSWEMMPYEVSTTQNEKTVISKKRGGYGRGQRILLFGYGLSGLAATMYLAIWLRVLTIFLGSSFFALSLILSAFLSGLALGSLCLARFVDTGKDLSIFPGLIEIIIGLSFLGIIPILERYPLFIDAIQVNFAKSSMFLHSTGFLLLFFIMFIPALLLGLSFPQACSLLSDKINAAGRLISAVFSINALGCMTGILSGGILLTVWPGLRKGKFVPVWILVFTGCMLLSLSRSLSQKIKITMFILLAGSLIVFSKFIPIWEMPFFRDAPYRFACHHDGYHREKGSTNIDGSSKDILKKKKQETLFYKEGIINIVSVIEDKEDIVMRVNGGTECSTGRDLAARVLTGHIPLLLHNNPQDILLIGHGCGITLGSIMQYPVREMECVEFSEGIIKGSKYFDNFNNDSSKDPRLKIIVEDARHYLTFTDKKYDVIISQSFNIWPEAIADLPTREFFILCRERLKSGGVAAMSLPVRDMNSDTFKSILFTWQKIFPFMNLWETIMGEDYLLIGSNERLRWDYTHIVEQMHTAEIASDLSRINIKDPPLGLLALFFLNKKGLPSTCFTGEDFLYNDEMKAYLVPSFVYGDKRDYPLKDLQQSRGNGLSGLLANLEGLDNSEINTIKVKIDKAIEARRLISNAYIHLIKNESRDKVLEGLKKALQINPDDRKAIELYTDTLYATATDYANQKRFDLALWTLLELLRVMPDNLDAHYFLGKTYYDMGLIDQAIREYEKVIESRPEDEEVNCQLGIAYLNNGWIDLSMSLFNRAIRINPDYADPHLYLGAAYFKKDMIDNAIEEYKNAIFLSAANADAHYNLGIAYLKIGMIDEAVSEWQEVIRIRPDDINSRYNLAMAYYNHGDIDQSIIQLEEAIKYKPDFSQARSLLEILHQMS
ncbi:MAG: fused MFS/spermidine synthase, partial [bacterium]